MEQVIQAAGVCVIAALLGLTLRRGNPETALLLALAAAVAVLLALAGPLGTLLELFQQLAARTGMEELFAPLYKTVAIALVVRIGGGLCRDAGESALSSVLELAGTVCALLAALPLLESVLDLLVELTG